MDFDEPAAHPDLLDDEAQEALASVEVELVAKLAACRRDLFFDPGVRVRRVKTAC